jgi:hypothetical protein
MGELKRTREIQLSSSTIDWRDDIDDKKWNEMLKR